MSYITLVKSSLLVLRIIILYFSFIYLVQELLLSFLYIRPLLDAFILSLELEKLQLNHKEFNFEDKNKIIQV